MKLINDWYYFIGALDEDTCEKFREARKNKFLPAQVGDEKKITDEVRKKGRNILIGGKLDNKSRDSNVAWVNEQWVFDTIFPYMNEANEKSGWKFNITGCETPQLTEYKKGGFYGWHIDGHSDSLSVYNMPDNKFLDKNVRKISMTLLLNEDYEGGEFQLGFFNKGKSSISTPQFSKKGSIIFFPSFINHQVAPVTKGVRYSLVAWFVGPPFK